MMGMAGFTAGTGGEPAGAELPADGHHIPDTEGEIGPLFNDAAPGGPDRRSITGTLQNITEGFHVFRMETDVQFASISSGMVARWA